MRSIKANFNNVLESYAKLSQSLSPYDSWALDLLILNEIYYCIK